MFQSIEDVLIFGIDNNSTRFLRTRFDNTRENHIINCRGGLDKNQMLELKEKVDQIVADYERLMNGSIMTKEQRELSKVMYIYNYLIGNVRYTQCEFVQHSSNVFGGNPMKNSIYGALVMNDAVCSGDSEAFDCLCKVMEIESKKVVTDPIDKDGIGGGHAFNTVKIGNNWYRVDAAQEIGLNPGHKIRGGKWKDRNFLVEFDDFYRQVCCPAIPDCPRRYPRELIAQMKKRLENRGLRFEYEQSQILTHSDVQNAVSSFLRRNLSNGAMPTSDIARNFERALTNGFKITKRNGIYIPEHVIYTEQDNILTATGGENTVDLYPNRLDSRFIIKSDRNRQQIGFVILSRSGQIENSLEIDRNYIDNDVRMRANRQEEFRRGLEVRNINNENVSTDRRNSFENERLEESTFKIKGRRNRGREI